MKKSGSVLVAVAIVVLVAVTAMSAYHGFGRDDGGPCGDDDRCVTIALGWSAV